MEELTNEIYYGYALGGVISSTDGELKAVREQLDRIQQCLEDSSQEDLAWLDLRLGALERQQLINNGARLVEDLESTARGLRNALDSYANREADLAQAQLLDVESLSQALADDLLLGPVKALLADLNATQEPPAAQVVITEARSNG